MALTLLQILEKFQKNQDIYRRKEIGDGTQDLCKNIFESEVFSLESGDIKNLGNFRYEAMKEGEGDRGDDFILNIDGIIVPVEVERLDNIEKGEPQIKGYMGRKNTLYGILTDAKTWKFYTRGYSEGPTLVIDIYELLSQNGIQKMRRLFLKKDYYINSFSSLATLVGENGEFVLEDFHNDLIQLAEDLRRDFSTAGAFGSEINESEQIKGVYSFIIQFLLLKIIQDKKEGLDLLGVEDVQSFLDNEKWNKLIQHIFKKLEFLGEFYTSYRNEQEALLAKIRNRYTEANVADYDIDALKPFLDLYVFIIKYNFKHVKQDIFGAVYENYLKELYREDNIKKGQVFTPPEIVDFILDEAGYTKEFIQKKIESFGIQKIQDILNAWAPLGKTDYSPEEIDKQYFNIPGLSIIDPACGSGTFLYKAATRIVNAINSLSRLTSREKGLLAEALIVNNIVGFDIEAFPLYLAEMNILTALLYHNINDIDGKILNKINRQIRVFSTKDSIAEFAESEKSIIESIINSLSNIPHFSASILSKRDEQEIVNIYMDINQTKGESLRESIKVTYIKNLFGSHIGSPGLAKDLAEKNTLQEIEKLLTDKRITQVNETLEQIRLLGLWKQKGTSDTLKRLDNKISDLLSKYQSERMKFDFVVGNPPYISYNEIAKEIKNNWKRISLEMGDVFGVNLHSIPNNRKKYSPKPNLYSYFNALAYFLAKDEGKVAYILPEGFINYDCNAFFLVNCVTLKKVVFFNEKLFIERGILGTIEIPTSAVVYIYEKKIPDSETRIHIETFDKQSFLQDIGTLQDKKFITPIPLILENLSKKDVPIRLAQSYISEGLTLLKKDEETLMFLRKYKENSNEFSLYFQHDNGLKPVADKFYVDGGLKLDDAQISFEDGVDKYPVFENQLGNLEEYYIPEVKNGGYVNINDEFSIIQGSQGKVVFQDNKFKILWRTKNMSNFKFTDWDFVLNNNQNLVISSSNRNEILYLFGLLNSKIIRSVFGQYKLEGEKEFILSISSIKTQFRVPKIDSTAKKILKDNLILNSDNIIKVTRLLQSIKTLGDIMDIDFSGLEMNIKGLKLEYKYIPIELLGGTIGEFSYSTQLSKDILKFIRKKNPEILKLESERDKIVQSLYGL